MLPRQYFERLTQAGRIRTETGRNERRQSIRMPVNMPVQLFPVSGSRVLAPIAGRMRDVSTGGMGVLLSAKEKPVRELVALLSPRGQLPHWAWCRVQRLVELDGICQLAGCRFLKILVPGQTVVAGESLMGLTWIDVSGDDAPEDPYELLENPATDVA